MSRLVSLAAVVALLLAACGSSPAAPTATLAPSDPTAAPSSATPDATAPGSASPAAVAPTPVCPDREPPTWVDGAHPNDGVPDPGGRIFFSQFHRNTDVLGQIVAPLYAIDPDGSDLVQIMDCEMQRPRVSPDGTRLAFSLVMDDGWWQVATSAVDGSDLQILTSMPGFAETPDWSPDGSWLIYSHAAQACVSVDWDACIVDEGNRYSLWRINADGTDAGLIGDPDNVDWEPRLSPDGTRVVFSRFHFPGLMTLVVRDLATGEERESSRTDLDLEHPDWSPDGRWIIYNPTCAPGTVPCEQVEQVPADDLDATPVVLYAADETHAGIKPAYKPDGSRIVFGCKGPMCLMDADGSNVETLMSVPGTELNHFDWGVTPGP